MSDPIERQDAIDAIHCDITVTGRHNAELVAETIGAFADRIKALPSAQPELSDVAVSAMAVEEMLKDLLPERGMWEIEGDEAKTAICEVIRDALEGLWKLPFVKPNSKESSLTQKELDTISRQAAIDALDAACVIYDISPNYDDKRTDKEKFFDWWDMHKVLSMQIIKALPSVQPDDDRLERCKFEYLNACKIVAHPTKDTSKSDIYDAHAVIKALHPIFGDVDF